MNTLEAYKKALGYINDIEQINGSLNLLKNAKNNNEFETILKNLLNSLSYIELFAEYYDNSDYTEQYLIAETGIHFIDFPEIDAKIWYDYVFTRGNILNKFSLFAYEKKDYIPAEKAKEKIEKMIEILERQAS